MLFSMVALVPWLWLSLGLLSVAGTDALLCLSPVFVTARRSGHQRTLQQGFDSARIHQKDSRKSCDRSGLMRASSYTTANFGGAINATQESDSTLAETKGSRKPSSKRNDLSMPWNEIQDWAMRDKLQQYIITASIAVQGSGTETLRSYVLWRSMTDDVTELAGYPLSFLVERCLEMQTATDFKSVANFSPEVLPYLDDFAFEANGGLSGRIYGIRGVAEGTRILTTPVTDVERTLPKGFVRTADGQILYELGKPAAEKLRMETATKMAERVAASIQTKGISVPPNLVGSENNGQILDADLVNLAGLTAVVIAGATAMQSLSHHLTVNMFWV